MASTIITTNADTLKRAARKLSTHPSTLSPNHILNVLSAAIAGPGKNWGFLQGAPGRHYIQPGLAVPTAAAPRWILLVEGEGAYVCSSKGQALDMFAVLAVNAENKDDAEAALLSKGAATLNHPDYAPIRISLNEARADAPARLHEGPPVRRGVPLTQGVLDHLGSLIGKRRSVIIGGVTGSGKTALLQKISQAIPQDDRIVCIEECLELALSQPNVDRIHARQETHCRHLKNSVPKKPDFVILGELTQPQAYSELIGLGAAGHSILSTMNADSLAGGIRRIESHIKADFPQRPERIIREQIVQTELVYVFLHHNVGRRSPSVEVATISLGEDGELVPKPVEF